VLVVRGTKKLRDRVRATPAGAGDVSTTLLGDWFATALFWKPQVALLVNERTLLPVFMPLAPAATLLERIPAAIASVLRLHGVDDTIIASELLAMSDQRIAPTDNRSIVGVMREFGILGERMFGAVHGDLPALSMRMSTMIVGPLMKGTGSPDRELAVVLGVSDQQEPPSNVIQFPGSHRPNPALARAIRPRAAGTVFQLKVTLENIKPPVWRRVLVDASSTLDHVHEVLQAAFGWWNRHLHEFEIDGTRYGNPDPDDDGEPPTVEEQRVRLDTVVTAGSTFGYLYDFGDGWSHRVTVEKVVPAETGTTVPACIGGRRACPPEDCGGPWGYEHLLEALADPTHRDHRDLADWLGAPFDPEAFDAADFVHHLRAIRLGALDD
jgi:hypothetical protein